MVPLPSLRYPASFSPRLGNDRQPRASAGDVTRAAFATHAEADFPGPEVLTLHARARAPRRHLEPAIAGMDFSPSVEWGLLFPQANGEYQSPINLNSREALYDPVLLEVKLEPSYVACRDCEVINDGRTVHILPKSKSVVTGGPLPRQQEFKLHEVCFHWGRENQRGSEHTVNFKAFPMELHLIHWNSTIYSSIDEAVGRRQGIVIIALFVQIGQEHLGLRAVTDILPDLQYKGKTKTIHFLNPNTLLPDPNLRDYWVYEGSLTMPPCSENVTWVLYRYPLTVSQQQAREWAPCQP
nr:carbonic anhydrase-related protein-like isoform X3 [Paramormyrops kingsleyae]